MEVLKYARLWGRCRGYGNTEDNIPTLKELIYMHRLLVIT